MISVCKICWQNWISNLVQGLWSTDTFWMESNSKHNWLILSASFFLDHSASQRNVNPPGVHPAPAHTNCLSLVLFLLHFWHLHLTWYPISKQSVIISPSQTHRKIRLDSPSMPKIMGVFRILLVESRYPNISHPVVISSPRFFIRRVISSLDHLAHGINGFVQEWLDDEKAIQIVLSKYRHFVADCTWSSLE